MGRNLYTPTEELIIGRRNYSFFEDFDEFISADQWTSIEGDSGASTSLQDAASGEINLITGTTDNNEVYLHKTKENFLIADGQPMECEARIQYEEAATPAANIIFGFLNAWVANTSLGNDGTGPRADYDGAVFFKVDGGTTWQAESSDSTAQTTTDLTALNSLDSIVKTAGGTNYTVLKIRIETTSSTKMDVSFFIDDVLVIKHNETYSSPTEMAVGIGVKAGSGSSETLTVDYIAGGQLRAT